MKLLHLERLTAFGEKPAADDACGCTSSCESIDAGDCVFIGAVPNVASSKRTPSAPRGS